MSARKGRPDYTLLALTFGLLTFGLIMLYSSSAIWAHQKFADPTYFLRRQLLWASLGSLSLVAFSLLDYNSLKEWIKPGLLVTWLLLGAALFASPVGGARRWLRVGPVGIQPAELAKLCLILYLADYLDRRRSKLHLYKEGLLPPLAVLGLTLGLILLEPDLGNPLLIASVGALMLLVGGVRPKHLALTALAALPVVAYELLKYPYRRARLLSFLNPFDSAQGTGYQLAQALLAVGSGGWFGKGLGASDLKLLYLPAPHTDFVFAVLCEELGILGSAGLLTLFIMFLMRGFKISRRAPDLFGTLLAAGITLAIVLQAFFNMGVSIGLLPTKGLPLPFFSFGGSSLLVTMTGVGILLSISRQADRGG